MKPADLQRKVSIYGKVVTVDGMYLRIIVHANEHMGQIDRLRPHERHRAPWLKPGP